MSSLLQRIYETKLTREQVDAGVHDGGPWRGPSVDEWVAKIAAASTPKRELDAEGRFQPWIRREGAA